MALTSKIKESADDLGKMISKNTVGIEGLKKSIDFVFEEVNALKTDVKNCKSTVNLNNTKISELEQKLKETERYQRRWNLRLYGIPEQSDENLKLKVSNICAAVVSDSSVAIQDDIDIAQGFPNTFLEPPQHCTFCMSPLTDTPISGLGVATNELMS